MNKNLKLIINNEDKQIENKHFSMISQFLNLQCACFHEFQILANRITSIFWSNVRPFCLYVLACRLQDKCFLGLCRPMQFHDFTLFIVLSLITAGSPNAGSTRCEKREDNK